MFLVSSCIWPESIHAVSSLLPTYLSTQNHFSSQLNDLSNSPLATNVKFHHEDPINTVNNNNHNNNKKPDYVTPTVYQEELDTTALAGSI